MTANIKSPRTSEEENSNSADYSSPKESDPISEAKKLRANLSKPENVAKRKKILICKDFWLTPLFVTRYILTDLGSAQTVRINTVYSISIKSRERPNEEDIVIRTLKLFSFLCQYLSF